MPRTVCLPCRFLHETDNAVLIETEDEEEHWIPFSQVEAMHHTHGDSGEIEMTQWIAQQKGLI